MQNTSKPRQTPFSYNLTPFPINAPHFVWMIKDQVDSLIENGQLDRNASLVVRTTLDLNIQRIAEVGYCTPDRQVQECPGGHRYACEQRRRGGAGSPHGRDPGVGGQRGLFQCQHCWSRQHGHLAAPLAGFGLQAVHLRRRFRSPIQFPLDSCHPHPGRTDRVHHPGWQELRSCRITIPWNMASFQPGWRSLPH